MQYFKKEELIRCYRETGRCKECRLTQAVKKMSYGIDENIEALVTEVLDPARRKYGKPVVVNSGFRCPLHNRTVGGVANSQHTRGEAADIKPVHGSGFTVQDLGKVIEELGKFDQLIYYPTFIHVSWKKNGPNRKQILYKH